MKLVLIFSFIFTAGLFYYKGQERGFLEYAKNLVATKRAPKKYSKFCPIFSKNQIKKIKNPLMGLCLTNISIGWVQIFDGAKWQNIEGTKF